MGILALLAKKVNSLETRSLLKDIFAAKICFMGVGEKKSFSLYSSRFLAEAPCNKGITGKTNRSLITWIPPVHPGKLSNSQKWPKPPS